VDLAKNSGFWTESTTKTVFFAETACPDFDTKISENQVFL